MSNYFFIEWGISWWISFLYGFMYGCSYWCKSHFFRQCQFVSVFRAIKVYWLTDCNTEIHSAFKVRNGNWKEKNCQKEKRAATFAAAAATADYRFQQLPACLPVCLPGIAPIKVAISNWHCVSCCQLKLLPIGCCRLLHWTVQCICSLTLKWWMNEWMALLCVNGEDAEPLSFLDLCFWLLLSLPALVLVGCNRFVDADKRVVFFSLVSSGMLSQCSSFFAVHRRAPSFGVSFSFSLFLVAPLFCQSGTTLLTTVFFLLFASPSFSAPPPNQS